MVRRPNFLVFMTDHQRGDTILPDGPVVAPNVERLRRRAVAFTHAYCPSPHCCPSRATFFTGLYPSEHGVWNNVGVNNTLSRGLYDGVRTFSEDLKEAGYRLYLSGKWHVSQVESPADRGFSLLRHDAAQYRTFPHRPEYGEWDLYNRQTIDAEDTPRGEGEIVRPGYPHYVQYGTEEDPFGDSKTVEAAAAQLRAMKDCDEPFFLFTGVLGPHDPYMAPKRFLALYPPESIRLPESFGDLMEDKPALYRRTRARYDQLSPEEHRESIRRYYAFCSYEDFLFGRLLDALEDAGLEENTVVLYCSDHGDYVGAHGMWAKGLPCFREAYHVCAMMSVPGGRAAACDQLVSLADFAPTFLELAGVSVDRAFTGRSLLPLLRGEVPDDWRTECHTQTNGNEIYGIQRAVFTDKWKYVFNTFDFDELYDLENDPAEMHNLIYGPHPERSPYRHIVREMCRKLWRFAHDAHDNCVNPYIMTALAPFGPGILRDELERL